MPIIIYYDNALALHISTNPIFYERTKHIKIGYHVVRDKVLAGTVHLMSVNSKEQVADILIKSLHPVPFYKLQSKLGMIDIRSSLRVCLNIKERREREFM